MVHVIRMKKRRCHPEETLDVHKPHGSLRYDERCLEIERGVIVRPPRFHAGGQDHLGGVLVRILYKDHCDRSILTSLNHHSYFCSPAYRYRSRSASSSCPNTYPFPSYRERPDRGFDNRVPIWKGSRSIARCRTRGTVCSTMQVYKVCYRTRTANPCFFYF